MEPPPTITAQVMIDASVPDAPLPTSLLTCEPDTVMMAAPAPDPTWFCARPDGSRHGSFITLFPDGSIEIAGSYRAGLLDGPWERHLNTGELAEQGNYTAGRKNGHWKQTGPGGAVVGEYDLAAGTGVEKRWYDEGPLYSERALKAGVPHGNAKTYAPDGAVLIAARYESGKLDGTHTFGSRQTMRFDETFAAGVRRGPRQIWQSGLLVADENYDKRGKLDGMYTLWRAPKVMRAQGEFEKGRRKGPWVWFDRLNNKEREGAYIDGKKQGPWLEWWETKPSFSGNYTDGKPDGEFIYSDRNGNELGRFEIKDGTGTMLTFHANHKPSSRQHLLAGAQDGIYQELTPRGKVVVEGRYRADAKHGTWKEWTPDGALTLEQTWRRGKLHGTVKKFVDGKLAMESTYKDGAVTGPYAEYRNGKPAMAGQFMNDRKQGTWTEYNLEGQVVLTATYKAGVLDGPWRQLVDGEIVEGLMLAGRRTGTWTRTDRAGLVRKLTYTTP